jgi:SSS family solute:Na+ symporter
MLVEIVIIIYFLFIIGIGIYSAFKIKSPTDYYVAGKKAGLIPVSGSLLATILGGSAILGTIELSQKIGWAAIWFLFCAALGLFILIPFSKYVKRYGNYTLPELLGRFYGKKAETISSLIIPVAWLGIVAAQIIAAAKILNGLGFISYTNGALLAGFIFIAYTLLGGQLSILKTDTLQAVLIVIGLVALIFFSLQTPNITTINKLEPGKLFNDSFSFFDLAILVLTYSVTFVVGPDIYSRLFCAKSENVAAKSVLIVAIVLIPVSFGLTYLGIYSQELNNSGIISFASDLLPQWAYGLFIAALLSAVMSSADTTLLTSSMIFNELFTNNLNSGRSLSNTRWIVLFMGIAAIVTALFITSVIQALLFALTVFSGAFVVPTLAGLLKFKVNKDHVIYAIIAGGIFALTGKIIHDFYHFTFGNIIIILSYFVNIIILLSKNK